MIKILVVDDQMLTREGLRTILDLEDEFEVVGVAGNGQEACDLVESLKPDLVMMDIQMPVMDGITALKHIKSKFPQVFVLILTTFLEDHYIVDGMAGGASGYILKDLDADKMIAAIHDTVQGNFILPAPVAARPASKITDLSQQNKLPDSSAIVLTSREQELAKLLLKGYSNREISAALYIAEGTARNYISNLYSKLEVIDRVQAIVKLQQIMS